MKKKIPPTYLYAPFQKIERQGDVLFVEGYTFVNEVVPGEGGVRLKRSAMEAATPDYMQWGAVREMHGKNAAGVAMGIEWDEKGAYIRAKIVDREAQRKVEEGVYKGLSCGVNPTLVRGKDVDALRWIENSLVDRPKDPDCHLSVSRADDFDPEGLECEFLDATDEGVERVDAVADPGDAADGSDAEGEGTRSNAPSTDAGDGAAKRETPASVDPAPEVERAETAADPAPADVETVDPEAPRIAEVQGEWAVLRGETAERFSTREQAEERLAAITRGQDSASVPARENLEGKTPGKTETENKTACPACGCSCRTRNEGCFGTKSTDDPDTMSRVEELTTAITRAETAETELARVQGLLDHSETSRVEVETKLTRAEERINELKNQPVVQAPVRFPHAATREFWANMERTGEVDRTKKVAELERLREIDLTELNPEERLRLAASINMLRQELHTS